MRVPCSTKTSLAQASIRTKLAAGFGLVFALVVAVGLLGHFQLRAVHHVTHEIVDVWSPRIELLGAIKRLITEHSYLARRQAQTPSSPHRAAISSTMDATLKTLRAQEEAYQHLVHSGDERALFSEFKALWSEYQEALRAVERGSENEARDFNTLSFGAFDNAAGKLDELIALSKRKSQAAEAHAHDVYELAQFLTIAAIIIAGFLSCVAIVWISYSVSSPILRISEAMRRLTRGDDSVTIGVGRERQDEIGALAAAAADYRDILVRSRHLAEVAELERARLHAAVNNMPIGLSMFDSAGRLIICNSRYSELHGIPAEVAQPGTLLEDIVACRARSGNFAGTDPEQYIADLSNVNKQRQPLLRLVELDGGRVLSIMHQPMDGGGWVSTHEDVTERRLAEKKIHHMARHDALTDLANRILFRDQLEQALKQVPRGEQVAVLCLDLDRFKIVNDTLGHPVGDALLKGVADRLRGCVRGPDTVARFGGDEFAIVQVGAEQPVGATTLAPRIIEALSAPFDACGHQVVVGSSIGIAVAPTNGMEAEQLLKSADMALYRAKCDGRGTYRFFEPEMDACMQARRALELDLRKALAQREFEVLYQPIIDVQASAVRGFEALLRWHHPFRGSISPAQFIPLAEEIGLIVPIGEWVLRRACLDAATWPDNIIVAVNLSPIQFSQNTLLETVAAALAVSKLPANRLELEITEGVMLVDQETTLAILHQLRGLGVRIAMDDFGTGYSSLSYLRSFPFDRIKIDSSFVRNMSDERSSLAIIRAVTGLSTSLGMATTAEGVETEDQLDRVRSEGCTDAQGFLFSEGKPASEVAELLASLQTRIEVAARPPFAA